MVLVTTPMSTWRFRLAWLLAMGAWPLPARAAEQMEAGGFHGTDLGATAHRLDSEVLGWNKGYTELACVALDLTRNQAEGDQGEAFLVAYEIGAASPKYNFHMAFINQLDPTREASPLAILRSQMLGVEGKYKRRWPRRPEKKAGKGAMAVEPIWEFVDVGDGLCQPAVGMLLHYKGEQRYQRHEILPMRADCSLLRHTDQRTVWAKHDLAAVLIRFDYGPPDNEQSIRFPLSARWALAKPVSISLHGPKTAKDGVLAAAQKTLAVYGRVAVGDGKAGDAWVVTHRAELLHLGVRIAAQLSGRLGKGTPPAGVDILIERGPAQATDGPDSSATGTGDNAFDPSYRNCGGLLPDCDR